MDSANIDCWNEKTQNEQKYEWWNDNEINSGFSKCIHTQAGACEYNYSTQPIYTFGPCYLLLWNQWNWSNEAAQFNFHTSILISMHHHQQMMLTAQRRIFPYLS